MNSDNVEAQVVAVKLSKCPHCKPEDYPMTGTPIYGCSCKCHNPAPQTSIEEALASLIKELRANPQYTDVADLDVAYEALSAIYNLLEEKAVDVQQSKRTSSGNDYRTSFKAVPLERVKELFNVGDNNGAA